jgi:hypothetical protein
VGRRRSIIIAAAGIGTAIALGLVGRAGPSSAELQSAAAELDGRIRETAAAATARAQTLAELPRLSWAVATDEQTMLDMTADELAFQPAPGELIEIGQVRRRDGAVTVLRRVGDVGELHLPLAETGARLIGSDGKLHVVDVVGVEPKTRADQIRGAVGVSRLVDTAAMARRMGSAAFALRVDVPGGGGIFVGAPAPGAHPVPLPLYADAAHGARLTAMVLSSSLPSTGFLAAALAVLVASLLAAALLWRRHEVAQAADDPPLTDLATEVHIDLRDRR